MDVVLPPGPGWSGIHLTGRRSAGDTSGVEAAGAVVVKRSYRASGGALAPDAAGEGIVLADSFTTDGDGSPWQTVEGDTAIRKRNGDLIVLGAPPPNQTGSVHLGGTVWLRRNGPAGSDVDLGRNLFGWHPKQDAARLNDARMLTQPQPDSPGDRLDRFHNAQRRAGNPVTFSRQAALPDSGSVAVRHGANPGDPDISVLDFSYAFPALRLTLFLAEPGVPDREERWCPHEFGDLDFDTLIIRPGTSATVSAVWRQSWPLAAAAPDRLRRAVVSEGGA